MRVAFVLTRDLGLQVGQSLAKGLACQSSAEPSTHLDRSRSLVVFSRAEDDRVAELLEFVELVRHPCDSPATHLGDVRRLGSVVALVVEPLLGGRQLLAQGVLLRR